MTEVPCGMEEDNPQEIDDSPRDFLWKRMWLLWIMWQVLQVLQMFESCSSIFRISAVMHQY